MKIYTAGPISGHSYDEIVGLYKDKTKILRDMGYEVLCPMTGKEYLRNELEFRSHGFDEGAPSTNHAIFERDKWMVSQVDIVLCDFSNSGDRVSIGSCMELAIAAILDKHTISVIPKENIHEHAFVLEASDIVYESIEEALDYLDKLSRGI